QSPIHIGRRPVERIVGLREQGRREKSEQGGSKHLFPRLYRTPPLGKKTAPSAAFTGCHDKLRHAGLRHPRGTETPMAISFDAIVIGTGQAGPPLARRLARAGMKVAVIERKFFGGTCVNTGCIPTKTMVASAYAARMAQRAAEFGVDIAGGVSVDMRRVKARKDAVSEKSRTGLEKSLGKMENCTVYRGHGRLESA